MNRRTTVMLTGMTLLGLAMVALPQVGFAQSDPWLGTWQLNLAKSKYSPGPPPKSLAVNWQGEGQNRKITVVGVDAQGNPIVIVMTEAVEDGKPDPVTGSPDYDAHAATRVDAHTRNASFMKAGKVVRTGILVVSQDGKSFTQTVTGTDANGRQINNIVVADRQ